MSNQNRSGVKRKFSMFFVVVGVILLIVGAVAFNKALVNVNADEIVVTQDPFDGELHFYFQPGLQFTRFGQVTTYTKESQYWFSNLDDQGDNGDQSIKIRFSDGGHAKVSGSFRWKLPLSEEYMRNVHTLYGSQQAVEQQLIRPVIEKSVYMTGPLMSSKESYSEKRNDLISHIEDQATHGVFKTVTTEERGIDVLSGKEKTFTIVTIVKDEETGALQRQEESPFKTFNITTYNYSINSIIYDKTVEAQIKTQQTAMMDVQTAIAEAKKAEQDAIKAEKEGQAAAAKAKWAQEEINYKEIAEAEKEVKVAENKMLAAEFFKKEQILIGEGEAARKRLVMQADGALEKKLQTYENVMGKAFKAMAEYGGNWVPTTVIGADASKGGYNGAQTMIDALSVKTLNDLALDMRVKK